MSSDKKRLALTHPDSEHAFQQAFLSSLQDLSNPYVRKKATQDLRDLLQHYADSPSRLHLALSLIAKTTENPQKSYSRSEVIQTLGLLAELFQGKLIEFMPKIVQIILINLADEDPDLHVVLRDTLGKIVEYVLNTVSASEGSREVIVILKNLWRMCRATSKCTQIGAAMSISKLLQISKGDILKDHVEKVSVKLVRLARKPACKAKLQLMDCIMNLVLAVDNKSNQLPKITANVMPCVLDNILNSEKNIRKISLEIMYYLTSVAGDTLARYKVDLIQNLKPLSLNADKDIQDAVFKLIISLEKLRDGPQEEYFVPKSNSAAQTQNRGYQKERTNPKAKYEQQYQKDLQKTGVVRESNSKNSLMALTPNDLQDTQSLHKSLKDKGNIVPFSAKNRENIPIEAMKERVYPQSGAQRGQGNYSGVNKEVSRFDDFDYTNKLRSLYTKQGKSSSENLMNKDIQELDKNRKPEISSDASTGQFTGDGSKKSNASSPAQPEIPRGNIAEILTQLQSINHKQTILMEDMNSLRFSTQDELSLLKNRLNQLEGIVGKLYVQQKEASASNRSSVVISEYNNPLRTSYAQVQEQSRDRLGLIDRLAGQTMKSVDRDQEDLWQEMQQSNRNQEGKGRKSDEVKSRRPRLWMELDGLVHKKNYTEAYELCLKEGDEEALLYLMKETGPVIEKLKRNLGEVLLNKLKSKLYDNETRPLLLDWVQRALISRVPIAKGILIALQGILRQVVEYKRGLHEQEKENILRVCEYIGTLLENLGDPQE